MCVGAGGIGRALCVARVVKGPMASHVHFPNLVLAFRSLRTFSSAFFTITTHNDEQRNLASALLVCISYRILYTMTIFIDDFIGSTSTARSVLVLSANPSRRANV